MKQYRFDLLSIKQEANVSTGVLKQVLLSFLEIVSIHNGEIPDNIQEQILYSEYCYDDVVEESVINDHGSLPIDIRIVCTKVIQLLQMHKFNLKDITDYGVEDGYFNITVSG